MKRNNILELGCLGLIVVSWVTMGYADDSAQPNKRTKSREQLLAHVESLHGLCPNAFSHAPVRPARSSMRAAVSFRAAVELSITDEPDEDVAVA